MGVDCRHYVRDLALAATLFAALGLTSAAYAQSLNAAANIKSKVRLGSVVAPSRCRLLLPTALLIHGCKENNCVDPNLIGSGLVKSCVL